MADDPRRNRQTDGHVETHDPQPSSERREISKPPSRGEITSKEKSWAILSHISYFVLGIIAPLLIFFLHEEIIGEESAFVRHHAKQALFWHIASLGVAIFTCGLGAVAMAIWAVIAAAAANKMEWYKYPLTGDFAEEMDL